MKKCKAVVVGAYGKMGREVSKGVLQSKDFELAGAVDTCGAGQDVGELLGMKAAGIKIVPDLAALLAEIKADVVIDFSHKEAAAVNVPIALKQQTAVVMGTTGFTAEELQGLDDLALQNEVGMFYAPNFSLGAVLIMKYARELARYFPQAEIIEYHNDKKKDAPSGTALATAQGMREAAGMQEPVVNNQAKARGGEYHGYQIHSVRLQSMIAHQEVIFAGTGEILTIRHDSFNRECFIPGVLLAARQVHSWQGLKIGLDNLLELFAM